MKKITVLILSILAVLVFTGDLYAQRGWDPKAAATREKNMLYKKAEGLTEDQKMLIEGIYDEYAVSMDEIVQVVRKTRNWREMRPKMTALREEKTLLMQDLLNDTQYAVYANMMAQQEKQLQQRRQQREQQAPPDPNN